MMRPRHARPIVVTALVLLAGAAVAETATAASTPTTTIAACSSAKGITAVKKNSCPKGSKKVVLGSFATQARGATGAVGPAGPQGSPGPQGNPGIQGNPGPAGTLATLPFNLVQQTTGSTLYTSASLDGIQVQFECGDARIGTDSAMLGLAALDDSAAFSYHAAEQVTTQNGIGAESTTTTQLASDGVDNYHSQDVSVSASVLSQDAISVQVVAANHHELTLTASATRNGETSAPACTFTGALVDNGVPGTTTANG